MGRRINDSCWRHVLPTRPFMFGWPLCLLQATLTMKSADAKYENQISLSIRSEIHHPHVADGGPFQECEMAAVGLVGCGHRLLTRGIACIHWGMRAAEVER